MRPLIKEAGARSATCNMQKIKNKNKKRWTRTARTAGRVKAQKKDQAWQAEERDGGDDRQAPPAPAPHLRTSAPQPNPPKIRGAFPIAALVAPLGHSHRTHPACHAAPPSHNPSARRLLSPAAVQVLFHLLQAPRPDVAEFASFPFSATSRRPSAAESLAAFLPQSPEIPTGRTNKPSTRLLPCRSGLPILRRGEGETAPGESTTPSEDPPAPGAVPSQPAKLESQ